MIRKARNNIGKLVVITWEDAYGDLSRKLEEVIKEPLITNYSVGWLQYIDKTKIIITSFLSSVDKRIDPQVIPTGWIKKIEYLE